MVELLGPEPVALPVGLRVLAVDDNATNLRVLTNLLRLWSVEADGVSSGAEALERLNQARSEGRAYGLVVSDVHMPEMDGFEFVDRLRQLPDAGAQTPVVMLSSVEQPGDKIRSRHAGVSAYVTKPVRRDDLRTMIARSVAVTQGAAERPVAELRARRSVTARLDILLAEDNVVNQRVAVRILESAGHRVSIAGNGHEAIEQMERGNFDLILMDVQMPVLDGIEATRTIRHREAASGNAIPIVAMTANAMTGDRERCLAAGMDDYISKPIRAADLLALIAALGPATARLLAR